LVGRTWAWTLYAVLGCINALQSWSAAELLGARSLAALFAFLALGFIAFAVLAYRPLARLHVD
jgi:hypothetical protein